MKILVISDTHGSMAGVEQVLEKHGSFDLVIHLGDIIKQEKLLEQMCKCPVKYVCGNCDYGSENPIADIVEFGKNRALITHGHYYDCNWGIDQLCYAADGNQCNMVMYGHTHIPEIVENEGIIVLNPGSLTRPRQLNRRKSYIIIEVDEKGKADYRLYYL
ncbi:MAG: metallophosphoesterase [Eubacterium sp.]|nr:metallophosphoesterase [Eubacterium sp.]